MKDNSLLLFLAGGAAGALAACTAFQLTQRREWNARSRQYDQVAQEKPLTPQVAPPTGTGLGNFPEDEILAEQFTRNVQFFGQESQIKIANAFVVVIGLGVGSPCKPVRPLVMVPALRGY